MVSDQTGSPTGWSRAPLDPQDLERTRLQRALAWPLPSLLISVESTFQAAAELARSGAPEGSTVVAEEQTAGRGRQGRSWSSPRGAGLWLTVIVDLAPAQRSLLPLAAGLAVRRVVAQLLPVSTQALGTQVSGTQDSGTQVALVKWPNDVVVADEHGLRKIAGLVATSLRDSGGADTARAEILIDLLVALRQCLGQLREDPSALLAEYRMVSASLGRAVQVSLPGGRLLRGTAVGIDATGALVVEDSQGFRELVTAGDVIHATI